MKNVNDEQIVAMITKSAESVINSYSRHGFKMTPVVLNVIERMKDNTIKMLLKHRELGVPNYGLFTRDFMCDIEPGSVKGISIVTRVVFLVSNDSPEKIDEDWGGDEVGIVIGITTIKNIAVVDVRLNGDDVEIIVIRKSDDPTFVESAFSLVDEIYSTSGNVTDPTVLLTNVLSLGSSYRARTLSDSSEAVQSEVEDMLEM